MKTLTNLTISALILMVAIPFSAYAVDGQIKIGQPANNDFPIYIEQPGSYVLTSNITMPTPTGGDLIAIAANNVTLDLNGFALIGPGKLSGGDIWGIKVVTGIENITIKNAKDTYRSRCTET